MTPQPRWADGTGDYGIAGSRKWYMIASYTAYVTLNEDTSASNSLTTRLVINYVTKLPTSTLPVPFRRTLTGEPGPGKAYGNPAFGTPTPRP